MPPQLLSVLPAKFRGDNNRVSRREKERWCVAAAFLALEGRALAGYWWGAPREPFESIHCARRVPPEIFLYSGVLLVAPGHDPAPGRTAFRNRMAFLSPDGPPVCRNPPCNTPRHLKSNWTAQRRRSGARPISFHRSRGAGAGRGALPDANISAGVYLRARRRRSLRRRRRGQRRCRRRRRRCRW
eukprot:scaffold6907_cov132-Isochrysis_galbana.AAC.2